MIANIDIAEQLIKARADINATVKGKYAEDYSSTEVIKELVRHTGTFRPRASTS